MRTITDKERVEMAGVRFHERFGNMYYPDNIEGDEEGVSFEEMALECRDAWLDNRELRDRFHHPTDLLVHMVNDIDWQWPSTFLEEQVNFD